MLVTLMFIFLSVVLIVTLSCSVPLSTWLGPQLTLFLQKYKSVIDYSMLGLDAFLWNWIRRRDDANMLRNIPLQILKICFVYCNINFCGIKSVQSYNPNLFKTELLYMCMMMISKCWRTNFHMLYKQIMLHNILVVIGGYPKILDFQSSFLSSSIIYKKLLFQH